MTVSKARISRITDADVLLSILDKLPTSIFVKNEDLRFELSNAAHCDIIRARAAELLGHRSDEFHNSDEASTFMARDREVLETGRTKEWEETARNQHGVDVPYLTRRSRLVSADGKAYLIGTSTNLSDLRKRDAQYRALAQTVPVGIWQVDTREKTIFANPLFLAYLGFDSADCETEDIRVMLASGHDEFPSKPSRFETDLVSRTGVSRRVLVISSGWLSNEADAARSAIVSVVDMTEMSELKRVNDEISRLNRELADNVKKLKDAQDELLRKGKMAQLGQIIATVAHEIRNPLGAVRTASFLIERKIKDKGLGIEPQLSRISNGVSRCDAIITQLLDFSRSRALQLESAAVDEWLSKIVAEEAEKLPDVISIECDLGLGPLAAAMDVNRMNRVIINLLSNASEAMVGKGDEPAKFSTPEPRITIASRLAPRGVEIIVSDNGPGITEDNLKKILEPLFTTKSFGTGLGLSAVEKILQEHEGGLEIASIAGRGASFTAWFPARQAKKSAA